MRLWGGIEAGGTKFVCAVGSGPDNIVASTRFPTTTPAETISQAVAFFAAEATHYQIAAIGIGAFGPADPNPASSTFGYVTTTPKPGWNQVNFAGAVQRELGVPIGFDTDVNVAALGEQRWGVAQGLSTFVYLTIGTGIGGGIIVNNQRLHGLMHPEVGHMRLPHDWVQDPFPGNCPVHGDCWEGLAAGPAIAERWGTPAEMLPPDHPAWALEAHYLALGVVNLILTLAPERVVMGGGVMEQRHLFSLLRYEVQELLNGYLPLPAVTETIDGYIVPPALGSRAGVLGAIALAQEVSGTVGW